MKIQAMIPTLACLTAAVLWAVPIPAVAGDAIQVGDPYPLTTDALTGEPLGDQPVKLVHEDRELRFTNQSNADTFRQNPARHLEKVDERIVRDQLPHYALDHCPISGQPLGEMGEPDNLVYRNRLVRLCCPGCRDGVAQDAAEVIAKLDAAVIEKQKADYPLQACPVSGEPLGSMGEPKDVVIANRLVRLCCEGCIDELQANAAKAIGQLDAARGPGSSDEPAAKPRTHGDGHGHDHAHPHAH